MKRFKEAFKNYNPSKKLCLLYFIIPILMLILYFEYQDDLWFILNYGKYIINNGFATIDPFTIHENLAFIMQQWLTAVIFYGAFKISFKYGLFFLCLIILIIILFLIYKFCMLLSNNNYQKSTLISIITVMILLIFRFITPRPQIIDFTFLLGIIYILEKYKKNKNTKLIYFLPLISLLEINFHSMLWFMLFIFMLPYIAEFLILKFKKKDNRIYKLLLIMLIMFLMGFINPYGIKSIINVFTSYGNPYAELIINELMPTTIKDLSGLLLILIFLSINTYLLFPKNKKLEISHLLLFYGTFILALMNGRSISLFIIASIPLISAYTKKNGKLQKDIAFSKKYTILISMCIIFVILLAIIKIDGPKSQLEEGIDVLLSQNKAKDIVLYTNFDNGPYAEYRGIKCYIDTRAEIFYKSNNKKADIFKEYYMLHMGQINYKKFVDKYQFTHLLINKDEWLYQQIIDDDNYKLIYESDTFVILKI